MEPADDYEHALGYSFTYRPAGAGTAVHLRGAQGALGRVRQRDEAWKAVDGHSTLRRGFPTRLAAAI